MHLLMVQKVASQMLGSRFGSAELFHYQIIVRDMVITASFTFIGGIVLNYY